MMCLSSLGNDHDGSSRKCFADLNLRDTNVKANKCALGDEYIASLQEITSSKDTTNAATSVHYRKNYFRKKGGGVYTQHQIEKKPVLTICK